MAPLKYSVHDGRPSTKPGIDIDNAFVAKCGIKQSPTEGRVSCAGGKSVPMTSYVLARVQVQALF